ncbi:hypothetical protein OHA40_30870 [Nocardia sp. NBC_00508]|uniref:hypothetical protein n=1 Tax=Nocardia sp. NBC_00508 TaxID=2975992 RepID=UPI002E812439|nr:hypothetical protein [Nocardia sp. NBC_00508]WUD65934.1 hypothetical protein OHA40_30870 [Nocardia sp. NBC_00508]
MTTPVLHRLRAALALEWRVQLRLRLPLLAAGLAAVWAGAAVLLPSDLARPFTSLILFLDTAGFGVLFAVFLLLGERTSGAWAALWVSPLGAGEYVAARLTVLTLLATASTVPIALAARPAALVGGVAAAAAGTALLTVLLCGLSLAACARARHLSDVVAAVPLMLGPLLVPALMLATGLVEHPLLYAAPTSAAHSLVLWGLDPAAVPLSGARIAALAGYAAVSAAGACALARWALARTGTLETPDHRPRSRPRSMGTRPWPSGSPLRTLAHIDLIGAARDPVTWALLAGPALTALGLRFGLPLLDETPVVIRTGLDLNRLHPVLLAALVLLHVPLMVGGMVALRTAEDREQGAVTLLGASPLGIGHYLAYRAVTAAVLTAAGLAAALPLSGLADGATWPLTGAALLATALAPAFMLIVTAAAANRVRALAMAKAAGALFTLLPVAAWALGPTWAWVLAPLPPLWPVAALPGYAMAPTGITVPAGATAALVLTAALWRRASHVLGGC